MIRLTRIVTGWLLPFLVCVVHASSAGAANAKPLANAGEDLIVGLGAEVGLNGAASADSDGVIEKFRWVQTKGIRVKLTDATLSAPSFKSPKKLRGKAGSARLTFALTVTDDKRGKAKDTVVVTVAAAPVCPDAQVLSQGVCRTPPVCLPPQVLHGDACVTPLPTCKENEVLQNGVCVDPRPVCVSPQVLRGGVCVTPDPQCAEPEVLRNGLCTRLGVPVGINDTGVRSCSDSVVNGVACPLSLYPGQDAEFGRDPVVGSDGDGRGGFSFTKIDETGAELPAAATDWACVRDNVTGLIWEVKRDDGGLRDKDLRYTNFSATHDPVGQYGAATDAAGYVQAVNGQGLCGASDWRLPEADELQGLMDYGVAFPGPVVDERYFPHTLSSAYWSATPYVKDLTTAWVVYFNDGRVFDDYRSTQFPVRLVRSDLKPAAAFSLSAEGGEVTDTRTGLIWRRCPEGMTWDGNGCAGFPLYFMWYEALQHSDAQARTARKVWRVPNAKELASVLDRSRAYLAIDTEVFPGTTNDQYWSSTPYGADAFYGWIVHFFYGSVYYTYLEDMGALRLVRDPAAP